MLDCATFSGVARRPTSLQVSELVVSTCMELADLTTDIIACAYVMDGTISMPSRSANMLQRRNASCPATTGCMCYVSGAEPDSAAGLICMHAQYAAS